MVSFPVEMPKNHLFPHPNFLISHWIVPAQLSAKGGVLCCESRMVFVSPDYADFCPLNLTFAFARITGVHDSTPETLKYQQKSPCLP